MLSRRSRRQQSHRATDAGTLVRQNITKRIFRNHYVKEFRLLESSSWRRCPQTYSQFVTSGYCGAISWAICLQRRKKAKHIGFIHHRKMFTAFHGIFKSDFQGYAQSQDGYTCSYHTPLSLSWYFSPKVHATGQFADARKSGTIHQFARRGDLWSRHLKVCTGRMLANSPSFLRIASKPCSGRTLAVGSLSNFVTYGREQYSIRILQAS